MTEPLLAVIHNAATGEIIERELTADEIANLAIISAEAETFEAETQAKAAARTSALAKLKKLGLTAAEIEAL